MTNEEIKEKAKEIAESFRTARSFSRHPSDIAYEAAIQMADWADQNPRKGLWDSEKVIKWLRANIDNYAYYNVKTDECGVNDFEEDLQKAMEE